MGQPCANRLEFVATEPKEELNMPVTGDYLVARGDGHFYHKCPHVKRTESAIPVVNSLETWKGRLVMLKLAEGI
jgi:hypothetical protein